MLHELSKKSPLTGGTLKAVVWPFTCTIKKDFRRYISHLINKYGYFCVQPLKMMRRALGKHPPLLIIMEVSFLR
jgi:hypothetical protein